MAEGGQEEEERANSNQAPLDQWTIPPQQIQACLGEHQVPEIDRGSRGRYGFDGFGSGREVGLVGLGSNLGLVGGFGVGVSGQGG